MRREWWIGLAAVLAVVSCATNARALQVTAAPTIVFGTVRNLDGVPVSGAEVWIDGSAVRAVSSDSGEFRLIDVPSGRQKLMVRRVGFRPASKRMVLAPGDARQVTFALEGMLEELEAVLVTAQKGANGSMSGFWARRMVGVGVFITRDDIDRRHPPRTADLFQAVMGIHVLPGSPTEPIRIVTGRQAVSASRASNSAGSSGCQMQYYVDGMFMSPGTFSVDDISPVQIEGIEIFRGPSEIPARFRQRETGCGLVVIWTREPPARTKRDSTTDADGRR
jgi:hypothetical protein